MENIISYEPFLLYVTGFDVLLNAKQTIHNRKYRQPDSLFPYACLCTHEDHTINRRSSIYSIKEAHTTEKKPYTYRFQIGKFNNGNVQHHAKQLLMDESNSQVCYSRNFFLLQQ